MKIKFILVCFSIFSGTFLKAQTLDYYTGKSVITGSNYEYKITDKKTYLLISNTKNTKFRTAQHWPDGTPVDMLQIHYAAHYIDENQPLKIFKEAFTPEEITAFKSAGQEQQLIFSIAYIVSSNGDVIEAELAIPNHPLIKAINPDKLFELEQKIKQKVKFRVEERFKVLGYIQGRATNIWFDKL
jgi:hypothetical protein